MYIVYPRANHNSSNAVSKAKHVLEPMYIHVHTYLSTSDIGSGESGRGQ